MLDFQNYSLWILIAAFIVASGFVWAAGMRLSGYLDKIADKSRLGSGFIGLLLLGGITSLPEVATVSTASWAGNAPLAINNVLGSASINVVLLAVADGFLGRRALTSVIGNPTPLLQGVLDILLLAIVVAAIATGDHALFGLGAWSTALVPLFIFAVWLSSKYEHRRPWAVAAKLSQDRDGRAGQSRSKRPRDDESQPSEDASQNQSLRFYVIRTLIAALVILAAGYVLAKSGDAIAAKTGLGSNLIGLVLVGFATSLPEISSIYAAIKLQRFGMVLGDIFGTNIFNIVLIFLADALYDGPPVLKEAGTFEMVATLLAIVLTCIYLIGLLERRDRTIWRMGYPSFAVILTYLGGLGVLWTLTSG